MRAKTRIFGEIDIPQDKIITMEKGMIGFSELKNYTLIYNSEKENDKKSIMWLQSMDDGSSVRTGSHLAKAWICPKGTTDRDQVLMMKFATKQAEIRYMKGVTSRQRPISTWMTV